MIWSFTNKSLWFSFSLGSRYMSFMLWPRLQYRGGRVVRATEYKGPGN